jgi:uncharacterized protein (TIGR03083 family)
MSGDTERLSEYVEAWRLAVDDTVGLLRGLSDEEWDTPTDLAGWDVRAVAAHLAHLESELAGNPQPSVTVPGLPHVVSPMGAYTEQGPVARTDWPTEQIVDELERSTAARLEELRAAPPTDGSAAPPRTPGGIGWDTQTLLSNRVVDVWMHQQDIRRAVHRPGGFDTPAAAHTVRVLAGGMGYVLGKRVKPPAGTVLVLEVTGTHAFRTVLGVGADGRATRLDTSPEPPDVSIRMDAETFVVLAGGRRQPSDVPVWVDGDLDLGARFLGAMAITP